MAQYELNIDDYFRIIRKRKLIIAATFTASLIFSLISVSSQKPSYEAVSSVKIEERKTVAGLLTELVSYSPGDIMESAAKIITGYPVMRKVAIKLGLVEENVSMEEALQVASELQGSISTETVKSTNIIEIKVTGDNPRKVMELANIVAEVYIEENLLEKNKQARTERKFIEEQLANLENKLKENEESLRAFGNEVKGIRVSPSIQNKLTELEFSLLDLLQKYTEKHPAVKQIKDQIHDLESQLKGFSGQELEYARLTREVEVNKKLYAMLKEKLEESRITEAQKVSDVSIVNPAVLPTQPVGTRKKTGVMLGGLTGIILGFILAFLRESLDTSIGTIEDVENLLKLPVLGVVPPYSIEGKEEKGLLDKYLNVFRRRKHPKVDELYARLIVHHEPQSLMAEAYRAIRTNLKLSPSLKTILVTSASPQEGKTTVVTNLGVAVTQAGLRTLLVSADLRRPSIARTFGLKEEPGLTEVLNGTLSLNKAIRSASDIIMGGMNLEKMLETPGMENINILSSGTIPMNPAEILQSKELDDLILSVRSKFDLVLFDAPPVLPITDASLLAGKVDGVVLVYEVGRTARSALLRTKAQLESSGAKILGIVLNHIKPEIEPSTIYPYYYKYKYTSDPDKDSGKRHSLRGAGGSV